MKLCIIQFMYDYVRLTSFLNSKKKIFLWKPSRLHIMHKGGNLYKVDGIELGLYSLK